MNPAQEPPFKVRELSRVHQIKLNSNPSFWRRSFKTANRGIGVNGATLRRLLYNSSEPQIRQGTKKKAGARYPDSSADDGFGGAYEHRSE